MKLPGFVGPTYQLDAISFDCQRCLNLFPIFSETGTSKEPSALRSAPGHEAFIDLSGGPVRGAKTCANKRGFVVSGNTLYEIYEDATYFVLGTLLTNVVRVSMAENGTQLIIVDGTYGYIFNMDTDVFTRITDVDFPACSVVDFLDGYFVVPVDGTPLYAISNLYDGLTWDILDRSRADSNPDNLNSLIADHGNLWLFGDVSVEVHHDTGDATFPFELIPGAVIQTGCAAPFTVQKFDNTIAWLGVDEQGRGVVWKANGYAAQRLSTQAIEARIASAADFTESYSWVYHEQGHVFYCLQVKGLDTTLVYDGATGLWHERAEMDTTSGEWLPHAGSCHFFFGQMNLIGDRLLGKIYRQSLDIYDYDGAALHRVRVTPHLQAEKRNFAYSNIELDMETGRGLASGQGSDPMQMMRYSDDGGNTWSNERWASTGKIGEYKKRVRWSRLGSARDRVFEFRYTEPTFYQVNGCYINAT